MPPPTEEELIHETCPGNPGRSPCAVRLFYVHHSYRCAFRALGRLRQHGRLMRADAMRKMTIFKIAAAVLFALWLFFGDGKTSHRFVVLVAVVVGYQVFSRVKAQHTIQEGARLGMIELMQQHDFKPEHQHFHSSGNQVSGVAIRADDPRIVLASAGVPARLFHRSDVLGLASEKGKEKELQFKVLSMTGAGDKQVNKDVYVVDVAVKDLDTPRYKLYFQDVEHMRQWENRLAAWLDMHATA